MFYLDEERVPTHRLPLPHCTEIAGWVFDASTYHTHCLPPQWKDDRRHRIETVQHKIWVYGVDELKLDGDDPRWQATDTLPQPIMADAAHDTMCDRCLQPLIESAQTNAPPG